MLKKILAITFCTYFLISNKNLMAEENIKAEKCENISCVRKNIDKINQELLKQLSLRMNYVLQAGDIKLKNHIKTATDDKRANEVINQAKLQAKKYNLPDEYVEKLFKIIVLDSTNYEQHYMNKKIESQ